MYNFFLLGIEKFCREDLRKVSERVSYSIGSFCRRLYHAPWDIFLSFDDPQAATD